MGTTQSVHRAIGHRWTALRANTRGALWILLAAALFTAQATIVKHLGEQLHTFEIVFFRCFLSLFVLLPLILRHGVGSFVTHRLPMHLMRSTAGMLGMACYFYAFTQLPLADATAYAFTMPLFMIVLAVFLLGELVRWRRWTATAIGFGGVLIMAQPTGAIDPAVFVALLGSLLSAFVFVLIKKLTPTELALTQIFYFCVVGSVISIGPAIAVWQTPTLFQFGLLATIACLGTAGQFFAVFGWHAGEATAVAPFDYARLLFAGALGYIFFGELPGAITIAGAAVIVCSTLYIAQREARLGREEATMPPTRAGGAP